MLSVSKKLAKEREEMCRDLSRLHESMIELHDQMIMEMQVMIMIMIMIMIMMMMIIMIMISFNTMMMMIK